MKKKKSQCPYLAMLEAPEAGVMPYSNLGAAVCYWLNQRLNVRLSWAYTPGENGSLAFTLDVATSDANTWIAIGFNPQVSHCQCFPVCDAGAYSSACLR